MDRRTAPEWERFVPGRAGRADRVGTVHPYRRPEKPMPRNRQDTPREIRVAAVTDLARAAFLELGYAGTTLAEIARRAGVAPNAVRWYFPHKDDALAAVVDRLLDEAFGATAVPGPAAPGEPPRQSALEALLEAVHGLSAYRTLAPAVTERAAHSTALAACQARTHRLLGARVDAVVRGTGLSGPPARRARDGLLMVLAGELVNPLSDGHDPDLLRFVAGSVLAGAAAGEVARPGPAGRLG
jgi:TetR/AcrR family transcriptional repressor of mexAB-oprM operon